MKKEIGIYVHIPFCIRKCYYCDFVSFTNQEENIEKYIEAVIKEIESYELEEYNVTTIYIGGGTPSSIESRYIEKILHKIKEKIINNETKFNDIEITIEINPGTIDRKKLQDYEKMGINRLSIGLQSTNNEILKNIGRIHTYEEFLEGYILARSIGFDNINVDLMIGLPNQTIEKIKDSVEKVINLEPEHISVYSLIVEEGTKIENLLNVNKITLPEEELERNMYWYVKNKLELNGYIHYEISNFAKENKQSKHNVNCWEQKEYIGIGTAAYSYLNNIRYGNTSNIQKYIETQDFKSKKEVEKNKIRIIDEVQTLEDKKKEYMLLSLRKIEGVSIKKFKEKYVENPIFLYRKQLEKLVNENLLTIDGDNIKLTNKGLDLANLVWEEFV